MVNADGATGEKGIWGKRAVGRLLRTRRREDVGIAVFDHPENLRAPTYWHARAYGLLAANPFGVKLIREATADRAAPTRFRRGRRSSSGTASSFTTAIPSRPASRRHTGNSPLTSRQPCPPQNNATRVPQDGRGDGGPLA